MSQTNILFLKANSSSDCFLSGFRLGRSFFTLFGLLLRSWNTREKSTWEKIMTFMRTDMFWAHKNSFDILLCNKGLQRVVKGVQAADSSGSMAWGCWVVLADPTSWCWTEMLHGTKDEAGCGRWEPPSWPYPQHDERVWRGETEAEKRIKWSESALHPPTVYLRLKPLHQTTVNRAWLLKHSWSWLIFRFYIT